MQSYNEQELSDTTSGQLIIEIKSHSLDNLVNHVSESSDKGNSIWDVMIPLLIGAALTLITQYVIFLIGNRKERDIIKFQLISKAKGKVFLIAQIIKDLAMHKVHKKYFYRAHELKLAYDEPYKRHYEKGDEQRTTESKLDEELTKYFEIVSEYISRFRIKSKKEFDELFTRISNYVHPVSSALKDCKNKEELIKGLKNEEARLNTEYKELNSLIISLQELMR